MDKEIPKLIKARKTNFLAYFSYFEADGLRADLLDRIEAKRAKRLIKAYE